MCYTSADLDRSLEALEGDEGPVQVHSISPPKEAILFGGKRVSFYLVEGVGLIEIIDEGARKLSPRSPLPETFRIRKTHHDLC